MKQFNVDYHDFMNRTIRVNTWCQNLPNAIDSIPLYLRECFVETPHFVPFQVILVLRSHASLSLREQTHQSNLSVCFGMWIVVWMRCIETERTFKRKRKKETKVVPVHWRLKTSQSYFRSNFARFCFVVGVAIAIATAVAFSSIIFGHFTQEMTH